MASTGSGDANGASVHSNEGSSLSKVPKNAPGNRSHIGWKHGISIDGNTRNIKCIYCQKIITGGVYRLKHHLAGTQKYVGACIAVPDVVKKEMWNIVASLQDKQNKKSKNGDDGEDGISTQATINGIYKKELQEDTCEEIAAFFYENAIPLNASRSEKFGSMFEKVARHGLGFKPPSYHELRVKYLKKKVESTKTIIEKHRAYWKDMGCTIMSDGWTDKRRRTILSFLVNGPRGIVFLKSINASHIKKTAENIFKVMDDIMEEVGEANVVQIVTDNAANYKAAGQMLMEKRTRLYWTPCAAHCIDLMLEDFEKIHVHKETIPSGKKITTYIYGRTFLISLLQKFTKGKDLVTPAMTRFATSYLTLGCLLDNKGALRRMFTSIEWKESQYARTRDGKSVENVIMDNRFWKNIVTCLKGALPLIKVLKLVDSDEKPAMGYIYEAMDLARESIQKAFNGVFNR
ncbi:PREDICTED: uncharacterized protein LOC109363616 [Lupinus angustifolius]|uniref:uncharacterized protein LOC109363616 n=1 Tax=Lupinus angustifolius TaxID=3871 RepID=UPI00092F8D7F|nr:PREDICTED: uncharacterized protein LOC109363616 [Lupinus angustifolius]